MVKPVVSQELLSGLIKTEFFLRQRGTYLSKALDLEAV